MTLVFTAPVAIYEFGHHFLDIPIPLSPKQHTIASKLAEFITNQQTKTTAHFNNPLQQSTSTIR
jgi:hypothetical protein